MKNVKYIFILAFALLSSAAFAQDAKKSKTSIAVITSNIVCGMCEDNLDEMFKDFYAVKAVDYDVDNKEIIVTYNNKKTNLVEIEKRISEVGYQANKVMPVAEARLQLPGCCQADVCEVKDEK